MVLFATIHVGKQVVTVEIEDAPDGEVGSYVVEAVRAEAARHQVEARVDLGAGSPLAGCYLDYSLGFSSYEEAASLCRPEQFWVLTSAGKNFRFSVLRLAGSISGLDDRGRPIVGTVPCPPFDLCLFFRLLHTLADYLFIDTRRLDAASRTFVHETCLDVIEEFDALAWT